MDDRWRSVAQIAEYPGAGKEAAHAWVSARGMPGHRVGRLRLVERAEVDGWVGRGGAARRAAEAPR